MIMLFSGHRKNYSFRIDRRSTVSGIVISQTSLFVPPTPKTSGSKPTKKYLREVATYGINMAKWNAAKEYCDNRNWQFVVLTEKELGI
jgi:hypothetical protein